MSVNKRVHFENRVDVQLISPEEEVTLDTITKRGLTWTIRSLDDRVRISLGRFKASEEKIFLGTVVPDAKHWSKVLLSGGRAGCKMSFSLPSDIELRKDRLLNVMSSIDLTQGSLSTAIVGARFRGKLAVEKCLFLYEESKLHLEWEKDNRHDPRAVRVLDEDGFCLGYISREDNAVLWFLLSNRAEAKRILKVKVDQAGAVPRVHVNWQWPTFIVPDVRVSYPYLRNPKEK